jgi:hypothetical protein
MKHNYYRELFPSVARAVAQAYSQEIEDPYASGIHIIIDVTATAATPSVVPTIDGYDFLSGKWYNLLTGTAITTTGTTVLKISPDITALANGAAKDIIPRKWRLVMTHADTDSITYSIGANIRA